jgi:hypothetical protein
MRRRLEKFDRHPEPKVTPWPTPQTNGTKSLPEKETLNSHKGEDMSSAREGYENKGDTLKAKDFQLGASWLMTISKVEKREFPDRKDESKTNIRNIIFAHSKDGTEKGLVLNGENNDMMCDLFGDDMDEWANQKVRVKIVSTSFGNGFKILPNTTPAARQATPQAEKPVPAAVRKQADDALGNVPPGDDIPF